MTDTPTTPQTHAMQLGLCIDLSAMPSFETFSQALQQCAQTLQGAGVGIQSIHIEERGMGTALIDRVQDAFTGQGIEVMPLPMAR